MWVNCGAINTVTGQRFKTKKALKEQLKADPTLVRFDRTSACDGLGDLYVDEIPCGTKLSVAGPDPYVARNWYATVERTGDAVKVS